MSVLSQKFKQAINIVKKLESDDRYVGAFIFGSVARGEITEDSDLDVRVIVRDSTYCEQVNHPFIEGIKLDITFFPYDQLLKLTEKQITKSERIPFIAESIILFDKTGKLKKLRQATRKMKRIGFAKTEYQFQQYLIYNCDNKVRRNLKKDPHAALLCMNGGIDDVLKIYYRINRKWWVSNKRMLKDLETWDKNLANYLRNFLTARNLKQKFKYWSAIITHVSIPFGGKVLIEENNCNCSICRKNLAKLG